MKHHLLFEGGHENVGLDFGDGVECVRVIVFLRVGMFYLLIITIIINLLRGGLRHLCKSGFQEGPL